MDTEMQMWVTEGAKLLNNVTTRSQSLFDKYKFALVQLLTWIVFGLF